MEYKKKIFLKGLVITEKDLTKIVNLLSEKKVKDGGEIKITFYFEDDSQISSDDITIFESDYITEKSIANIGINYRSSDFNKKVEMSIYNCSLYLDSYITITSDNEDWFLSVRKFIEEKLESIKKQVFIWKIFNNATLGTTTAGVITMLEIILLNSFKILIFKDLSVYPIIFLAMIFTTFLIRRLGLIFPSIEFELDDKKTLKRKRNKKILFWALSFLLSQLLIPILLKLFFK